MTAARPVLPRLVALAPPERYGDLAAWAREWAEGGADALAVAGHPEDPGAQALLGALRRATQLPLEVQVPAGATPGPEWAAPLMRAGVDWLLPAAAPDPEAARAWAEAGLAWAWPLAAGAPPADAVRVHCRGRAVPGDWSSAPEAAERSLAPEPAAEATFAASGADTLVLAPPPTAADPAATLAGWRW